MNNLVRFVELALRARFAGALLVVATVALAGVARAQQPAPGPLPGL